MEKELEQFREPGLTTAPAGRPGRVSATPGRGTANSYPKPAEEGAALVPVRVSARPAEAEVPRVQQVALVSPSGWRAEGLSVESAAQLLVTSAPGKGTANTYHETAAFKPGIRAILGVPLTRLHTRRMHARNNRSANVRRAGRGLRGRD